MSALFAQQLNGYGQSNITNVFEMTRKGRTNCSVINETILFFSLFSERIDLDSILYDAIWQLLMESLELNTSICIRVNSIYNQVAISVHDDTMGKKSVALWFWKSERKSKSKYKECIRCIRKGNQAICVRFICLNPVLFLTNFHFHITRNDEASVARR